MPQNDQHTMLNKIEINFSWYRSTTEYAYFDSLEQSTRVVSQSVSSGQYLWCFYSVHHTLHDMYCPAKMVSKGHLQRVNVNHAEFRRISVTFIRPPTDPAKTWSDLGDVLINRWPYITCIGKITRIYRWACISHLICPLCKHCPATRLTFQSLRWVFHVTIPPSAAALSPTPRAIHSTTGVMLDYNANHSNWENCCPSTATSSN